MKLVSQLDVREKKTKKKKKKGLDKQEQNQFVVMDTELAPTFCVCSIKQQQLVLLLLFVRVRHG